MIRADAALQLAEANPEGVANGSSCAKGHHGATWRASSESPLKGVTVVPRAKIAILGLGAALLVSNAWWLYRSIDEAVTRSYLNASLEENKQALDQTLALLPVVARPGLSRAEILAAAPHPQLNIPPFEKEGFVWVDRIGLKFDTAGQLVQVSTAWSPR